MKLLRFGMVLGLVCAPLAASAASADAKLLAKLKAENQKLQAEIEALKAPKPAPAPVAPAPVVAEKPRPVAVSIASGDFSIGLGGQNFSNVVNSYTNEAGDYTGAYGQVGGRYLLPIGTKGALQFDAKIEGALDQLGAQNAEAFMGSSEFGTHLLIRDGNSYQLGAFGGVALSSVHDNGGELWDGGIAGFEGQAYFSNVTLWGQVGVGEFVESKQYNNYGGNDLYTPVQIRGGLRYFITPDTKIGLGLGYESGRLTNHNDSSVTTSVYKWSADIEHLVHLGDVPASMFLKYQGYHNAGAGIETVGGYEYINQDSHSVMLGLNVKFGTTSLLEQDRHGANTDIDIGHIPMIDTGYKSNN